MSLFCVTISKLDSFHNFGRIAFQQLKCFSVQDQNKIALWLCLKSPLLIIAREGRWQTIRAFRPLTETIFMYVSNVSYTEVLP